MRLKPVVAITAAVLLVGLSGLGPETPGVGNGHVRALTESKGGDASEPALA
jgi:hypothetical protein